jgi:hypothetical protein
LILKLFRQCSIFVWFLNYSASVVFLFDFEIIPAV